MDDCFDLNAELWRLWSTYSLNVPTYDLGIKCLELKLVSQDSKLPKLQVFSRRVPSPLSTAEAEALSASHSCELRWRAEEVIDLLDRVAPHIVYQYFSPLSFRQRPLRQLVDTLLSRPDGRRGVLMRHIAGSLYHGYALKLLLVPQLDADGKPLLLGCFFPVRVHLHRQGLIPVQPQQLLSHLDKQRKRRGKQAEVSEWEVQWEAQRLRPGLAIPYAEPKVSSTALLWSLAPGPLQYVTTNVVVARGKEAFMEQLGGSEGDFCAPCDCYVVGAEGCGGAEARRAIWQLRKHGVPYRVELRDTGSCGMGVFALEAIPGGAPLVEYLGEMISEEEEVRRRELYHKQQWHYLMTINHIHKAPAQGQQASGGQQHRAAAAQHQADDAELVAIDATYVGNISRYVNHMCGSAANCCVQAVCRGPNTPDTGMLSLLYTSRDIKAGEELRFDYNPNQDPKSPEDIAIKCCCGSPECRGYVFTFIRQRRQRAQSGSGAAEQAAVTGRGSGARGQEARRKPAGRQQTAAQAAAVLGETDSNGSAAPAPAVARKAAASVGRKKFARN